MPNPGVGRPKAKLAPPEHPVTQRIRRLIDLVHSSNLAAASRLTGIPYPTLRDLYAGRTANPELATLEQLRSPYGVSLNWFTDPKTDEEVPLAGRVVLLPPHPKASGTRALREVPIPYAARALFDVFGRLEAWLRGRAAGPDRPIVGEATGDAFAFRVTTFLLQPLLAAEKLGEAVIPTAPPPAGAGVAPDAAWVARLEALGEMWRQLLPSLLRVAAPGP